MFKVFCILAQIGGFYTFLQLIFGTISKFINENLMKMEFINQLKLKISNSKVIKPENTSSKVKPLNVIEEYKGSGKHFNILT